MTDPAAAQHDVWRGASYPGAPATVADAIAAGVDLRLPRWGLVDVAVLVLAGFLLPVVLLSVALSAGVSRTGGAFLLLAAATPWLVFAGWPVLTTRLQGNGCRIDLGYAFRRTDLWWGIGGGAACFLLATPVGLLTQKVFGDFDSAAGDAALKSDAPRWVLAVYALMVVVGAPLVEELAFRGLVFTAVAKRVARTGAGRTKVLIWAGTWSTLLFAGIHLEPVRIPVLLVIGAVLAYLRARTGRVGAGVVAHALNNLPGAISILLLGT